MGRKQVRELFPLVLMAYSLYITGIQPGFQRLPNFSCISGNYSRAWCRWTQWETPNWSVPRNISLKNTELQLCSVLNSPLIRANAKQDQTSSPSNLLSCLLCLSVSDFHRKPNPWLSELNNTPHQLYSAVNGGEKSSNFKISTLFFFYWVAWRDQYTEALESTSKR